MDSLKTMRDFAHWYVNNTPFRVFPLAAGDKVPLAGSHGFYDATRNHERIEELWKNPDYNIAVATGEGLLVIDLDCKNDGENGLETLHDLEHDAGMIPEMTWTAQTTTGGIHIYFHTDLPVGTDNHDTYPDIDIHGNGSYIVLPPSKLKNGKRYEWEIGFAPGECDLAEANEAVKKLFIDIFKADDKTHKKPFQMPEGKIKPGCRNRILFQAGGYLQGAGFPDSAVRAALEAINRDMCDPPVDDEELEGLIKNVLKYDKGVRVNTWMESGKILYRETLENLKARLTK